MFHDVKRFWQRVQVRQPEIKLRACFFILRLEHPFQLPGPPTPLPPGWLERMLGQLGVCDASQLGACDASQLGACDASQLGVCAADSTKSQQIRRNCGRFDEIAADSTKSPQIRRNRRRFDEIAADSTNYSYSINCATN